MTVPLVATNWSVRLVTRASWVARVVHSKPILVSALSWQKWIVLIRPLMISRGALLLLGWAAKAARAEQGKIWVVVCCQLGRLLSSSVSWVFSLAI